MPLTTIAASFLAVVPMVDRCRSALAQRVIVSEAKSDVRLEASEAVWAALERSAGLVAASIPSADCARIPLARFELPETASAAEMVRGDRADIAFASPIKATVRPAPVRSAAPRLPSVVTSEPRGLSSNALAAVEGRLVYDSLLDGTANPRAAKWRLPLVRMLVDATPGTDFDGVYGLLLRGFGGNDERTRIRALAKWADANLPPREAADVYRAETRYWLNLGDAAMTADAAGRMERARPDYSVRARRLSALAHATAGDPEKAKDEIARARAECDLPPGERLELLYIEAWIALQEGDVELARRNLTDIVTENPRGATARKAQRILESIPEEARE